MNYNVGNHTPFPKSPFFVGGMFTIPSHGFFVASSLLVVVNGKCPTRLEPKKNATRFLLIAPCRKHKLRFK